MLWIGAWANNTHADWLPGRDLQIQYRSYHCLPHHKAVLCLTAFDDAEQYRAIDVVTPEQLL